jgi:branched-chain amino acid transport system ATP-binding protein
VNALLQVKGLEVTYGPVRAVKGIDLEVPKGEIRAILGANGAGKSSIIRAIMGLVKARRGTLITGCKFSGMQKLLTVAMAYIKYGRRMRYGEKNTGDVVAASRMKGA